MTNPTQQPAIDNRLQKLDSSIKRYQYQQDALIEILHKAQEIFGYLEKNILLYIAHRLKLPPSQVYGVATFYHLFSLKPQAQHTCVVCTGTACYFQGNQAILEKLEKYTRISAGQTTADGKISLNTARCLGTCGLAPLILFDDVVFGCATPELISEWIAKISESP